MGRTRKEQSKLDYERRKLKYGVEALNREAREWRLSNPEKAKASLAKSRKAFPERNLLNKARMNAKRKGICFELELSDISIPEKCPLLGVPLDMYGPSDWCPSLDRIDNSKDYIKGNVWVISFKANRMKNTASLEELQTFCEQGSLLFNKDIG